MRSTLPRLQRALQRSIVNGESAARDAVVREGGDAAQRLEIYATAYRSRLQEALAHNFPMLLLALGGDRFRQLAAGYLAAHPSTHISVRDFGNHLSRWLETREPSHPWIAEFARFEWALTTAFDAPDQAAIEISSLAALDPKHWPQLQFEFAIAVQRVTLSTNAADIYGQISRADSVSDGHVTEQPSEWLIWRDALTARYRSVAELEAVALDVLRSGGTFAQMCEELFERYADESVPMQAAALLKRWVVDGLVVRLEYSL